MPTQKQVEKILKDHNKTLTSLLQMQIQASNQVNFPSGGNSTIESITNKLNKASKRKLSKKQLEALAKGRQVLHSKR